MRILRVVLGVAFVCLVSGQRVNAQIDEHRFEVGGMLTAISLRDFQGGVPGFPAVDKTVSGIGGRFAYNVTENLAIDAEGTFFPASHLFNEEFGQKTQGFIGVKAGWRSRRVGVFAKARPGVMWFGELPTRGSCSSTSFGSICGVSHEKDFALDLGGVVEFYPAERAILRLDAGDTIIRYQSRPAGLSFPGVPAATKHNLQLSIGFGWRF
ncbi:MAG: outer membrane beta-barrel protein [Pyrinomonadaceae bacterium]